MRLGPPARMMPAAIAAWRRAWTSLAAVVEAALLGLQLHAELVERALLELQVRLLRLEGVALVREVGPHGGELLRGLPQLLTRAFVAPRDRGRERLAARRASSAT